MTNKQRRDVARYFRKLLDAVGTEQVPTRKAAVRIIVEKCNVSQAALYNYCRIFNIDTK